jgi:hypothetical protein
MVSLRFVNNAAENLSIFPDTFTESLTTVFRVRRFGKPALNRARPFLPHAADCTEQPI